MSHVDEGRIHAWLDGALLPGDPERAALEAHLAACDECRARVEAERGIRDRAIDVLRAAAPDAVRVEPFEQMIAARRAARVAAEAAAGPIGAAAQPETVPGRVDSTTRIERAPSRPRRYMPLAWAASLTMAVTAGWFARTYIPVAPAGETDTRFRDAVEADAMQAPAASRVGTGAPVPAETPPTVSTEASAAGAGADDRRDAAGGRAALAAGETRAERETVAANEAVTGQVRRSTDETKRLAEAMTLDQARAQPERQQAAEPGSVPAAAFASVPGEPDPAMLAAYRTAVWAPITEAEATTRLGRAPARIGDLPIDSLQAAPWEGGWLVRVVQTVGAAGATAEILQWQVPAALEEVVVGGAASGVQRDAVERRVSGDSARQRAQRQEAAAAPPAPAAKSVAARPAVQLGATGLRVLLRADVPVDSLNALAARLR